jgi:hypothetical protein
VSQADLNGDGREGFISKLVGSFDSGYTGAFAVKLSTGDGAYSAPVCSTIPNIAFIVEVRFTTESSSPWTGRL